MSRLCCCYTTALSLVGPAILEMASHRLKGETLPLELKTCRLVDPPGFEPRFPAYQADALTDCTMDQEFGQHGWIRTNGNSLPRRGLWPD